MDNRLSRRQLIRLMTITGLGMAATPVPSILAQQQTMRQRTILSSNEKLPVVGLGTWRQFDVGSSEKERAPLRKVLSRMGDKGGEVIDTSPMYGTAEKVIGDLTTDLGIADRFFYATKVWTSGRQSGIDQMNASMRNMQRSKIDLMQIHNLLDWQTHLKTLKEWKEQGRIRYIGVTHYTVSSHERLEQIVKTRNIDFVQFNYSISTRNAEKSLLKAARDNGVAVIINQPYEGGSLFKRVQNESLPNWAMDYDIQSWGQFFLKFILSHPSVTCVIPGTSDPGHLIDNMGAGYGQLPDEQARKKMAQYFERL